VDLFDFSANAVLALPELRALIAERDELRATVARVREVLAEIDRQAEVHDMHGLVTAHRPIAARLRRALEATSRPRSDAQGVTGVSGSTRDDETVGDE
jgi:hypothetical protein